MARASPIWLDAPFVAVVLRSRIGKLLTVLSSARRETDELRDRSEGRDMNECRHGLSEDCPGCMQERIDALVKALSDLVNAEALSGVRSIVAGWNGEGRKDGPYQRHPPNLGATLPKTRCAAVYALDEAIERGRALVGGAL